MTMMEQLGMRLPIVAAPMAGGPSTPELVTAAARAGGIGFLAAGYKSPEQLAEQIDQVSAVTDRFGVNLFAPTPVRIDAEAYADYRRRLEPWALHYGVSLPESPVEDDDRWEEKLAVLEEHPVPAVSVTFGLPSSTDIRRLQRTGAAVLQTVTTVTEAEHADIAGADALIVQSHEAGGHSGSWTPAAPPAPVELEEMLLHIRAATDLPLWAAGGISTPDRVREVRAAGAEAAVVGTVLLRTGESGANPVHQEALAAADREATIITSAFSGRPARALENEFATALTGAAPLGFPALHHLTAPLRRAATAAGDAEALNLWAGTGWRDAVTEPAEALLRRLGS